MTTDITQITKTDLVSYTSGAYNVKSRKGALIKCSEAGTIRVEYLNDPDGTTRDIETSGIQEWMPDRIRKIHETGTTVTAASILIGYN